MPDRHADFADFAGRNRMVAVVAGLGRQIEGDGKAGLTLGQVLAVKRVRFRRRRMPGISAEDPGPVGHGTSLCGTRPGGAELFPRPWFLRCSVKNIGGAAGRVSNVLVQPLVYIALQNRWVHDELSRTLCLRGGP